MQNFLFEKDKFIYKKYDSITTELCDDIIELYVISIDKCNISNSLNFSKIKQHLIHELQKCLMIYEKQIFKKLNFLNIKKEQYHFIIEDSKCNNHIHNLSTIKKKQFLYIWFLNDYDGEISFFNDYKIIPKAGLFILFPISWCFPYSEFIKLNENRYIIYGYL